jgi:uncharacterized membrane-anchored protein YjiN (DUF445 family)
MTTMAPEPADLARRRGLRRMRLLALSLLVLAAVVFLLTLHRGGAWGYVNTTAEAAMVGALADWFAVTALFRHPLGLPVPHTAIIPTRKDALGQSLEEFVSTHFLTADAARERYAAADVTRRVGAWLRQPQHSTRMVAEGSALADQALERLEDEDVRAVVEHALLPGLLDEPVSPVAGHLLEEVVADGAHHGLVDLALAEAHAWLVANEGTVSDLVTERAPRWTPHWLNDVVAERIHREAVAWLRDIRDDPDHRVRLALDDLLAQLAKDLQHDEATMQRAESLKVRLLTHPQVGDSVVAVWNALRGSLSQALRDEDGLLRRRLTEEVGRLGERMVTDDALRRRLDEYAGDAIGHVVNTYGHEIASIISQTINRWDGQEAAERIELHVGRDLQFIRINGTIVGGLAGLLIHTVATLL